MRNVLKLSTRLLALAAVVGLAACSDQLSSPGEARSAGPVHRVALGGTETLAGSINLTPNSYGSWNVSIPYGYYTVRLKFTGRINWSTTAGNSNVLQIKVNGTTVTSGLTKGSSYTYGYSWSEPYYDWRGYSWGQPENLWGLFWSPNFTQNSNSSDSYFVSSGSPYYYEFDVTGLVSAGATANVQLTNLGGWVATATGNSPTVVLQNVQVSAF